MPSKEQLLNEYLLSAMDTGKVEMKSPRAGKGGEALVTAAENVLPFVGAAKSAFEGDYRNAMIQAGLDVALPPAVKGAAALGGKFLAPALMGAIKAYHGSPHKFDKFDMSKIGSGEGAQVYGHGLYFAENPNVAKGYQVQLTRADRIGPTKAGMAMVGEIPAKNISQDVWEVADVLASRNISIDEYINDLQKKIKNAKNETRKTISQELIDQANKVKSELKGKSIRWEEPGSFYETNLRWPDAAREAADPLSPHHFLDYDKPLSEQSDYVKSMLSVDKRAKDKLYGSGAEYYRGLTGRYAQDAPIHFSAEQAEEKFGMPLASQQLKALGIPGIRYLDAGSRSNFRVQTSYKGEPYGEPVSFMTEQQALNYAKEQQEKGFGVDVMPGTSNYVLFSDELADILKRNDEQLKAKGGEVHMADGGPPQTQEKSKSLSEIIDELPAKTADKLVELALQAYGGLRDRGSLPANQKVFLDTFVDKNKAPITEKMFSEPELRALNAMISSKGGSKGSIQYDDYGSFMNTSQVSGNKGVLEAGKNPYESLRTTLGQFNYRLDPTTKKYVVEDTYDFNRLQKPPASGGKTLEEVFKMSDYIAQPEVFNPIELNPYMALRLYAGRNMPEGQGRPVSINVPKKKGGKVEANAFPYGLRHDSELPKGKGYFGPMTTSSGDVMTEYSSSDDAGDYPLVVPTLTADEIRTLLSNGELTEQMLDKAQGWADARRKMGKSPFAGSDELRLPVPKKAGGSTTKSVKKR